ncbi:MAG: hypothetical protein A3J38_06010 [Gammaproteobacteria bacterium RIFCSPHIGHO2_12_FULL_45_9]|nr:MAG: hypothetical protein A3J38_06010 [Gammaproteobacteria bacterium RIFCSPHIGHO2_12_FULL_45_9]
MSDLSFQIQLGMILPKMHEKLGGDMTGIVDELVTVVQAGMAEGEDVTTASVKELVMKDFEIFIDRFIFPDVEKKLHPPVANGNCEGSCETAEGEAPAA